MRHKNASHPRLCTDDNETNRLKAENALENNIGERVVITYTYYMYKIIAGKTRQGCAEKRDRRLASGKAAFPRFSFWRSERKTFVEIRPE